MLKLLALSSVLFLSACLPPAATPDVLDVTVEAAVVDASAEVTTDQPAPRPDGMLPMDAQVDF